jgi:outer membrane protein assembly factor BamE (lipoprotein component of BamABCDE complex)
MYLVNTPMSAPVQTVTLAHRLRALAPAALLSACLLATAACTPVSAFQGFQAIEEKPQDVKPQVDTKSMVLERLGSPTAVSTFDPDLWFYMSQITDRVAFYSPKVRERTVVAISFDKTSELVTGVHTYSIKDGKVFAYNSRETPTRGRELTILEQLLGNVGRGGLLPQDDERNMPGGRRE